MLQGESTSALPGEQGRLTSYFDPAHQYYNKIKNIPRDVMDPRLKQMYLTDLYHPSQNTAISGDTFVGDNIYTKDNNSIRIVSQNIGCLGIHSFGNGKQAKGIQWLIENKVDIVAWQELGVAFHMQQRCDRLRERMRDPRWNKLRLISANNKHEAIDRKQFGGTSVMSVNSVAARVTGSGCDEKGLGRWSWMLFEGKRQWKTRIFSVYVPIPSKRLASVYQQHKRYYLQQNMDICPRKQLLKELVQVVHKCQRNGEKIIICTDANENLLKDNGQVIQALKVRCGLQEPLRKLHPQVTPPPTNQTGSKPIDSIFLSPELNSANKGGWLSFESGIGDHRPLFIDINFTKLLGEDRFIIKQPQIRKLKCRDPRVVSNFNKIFDSYGSKKEIYHKYQSLQSKFSIPMPRDQRSTLFQLDSDVTSAVLQAQSKCRKLKMGNIAYTAESAKKRVVIELWNNVIRKKSGANISSTYISRLARQCNIHAPMDLSIDDCKTERSFKYKELIEFAKEDKLSRKEFIDSLADSIAAEGNEKKSAIVRRLNREEEDRYARNNIRMTVKSFGGATTKVQLSNPLTGDCWYITEKSAIEEALRNENQKKYTLAYSSPFLHQPLLSLLGQDSLTPTGDAILAGTFTPPSTLSPDTIKFLSLLKMDERIQAEGCNPDNITVGQSLRYWGKKPEKISSSMSGRHIGTYKAACKATPAFEVITGIMNLAYRGGLSLPRWQSTLDVSLLKKPGKLKPSELRTIGQLEADFNQGATLHFSKRMMDRALKLKLIPEAQYAKKGSRCVEAALVKILYFEHLRFRRLNGTFMTKDLMQCFDRMAHPVSALCTRRLGVPPMVVKSMIASLSRMKHYMRTAYGDSAIYYGNNQTRPLQGAIQGNGAAAQIFIAISCVMIAFLESQCEGFSITTSLSLTVLSFIVVMYVDDADIMVSARSSQESVNSLIFRTQNAADVWRRGAEQTGAALRPHKCKWTLVAFHWKNNTPRYHTTASAPGFLRQKDTDGQMQVVERLEVTQSVKGLGIIFNPLGCCKEQFVDVKQKVNAWCNVVRTSSLTYHEVYLATSTGILRTIAYPLPLTSFSKYQCTSIDSTLYSTVLPRLGMNRHLPLVYRYGPKSCHGLALPQTVTFQYSEKLKMLIQNANQPTDLGHSIISTFETFHLAMGVHTPIFQLDYSKFQFLLEPCWVKDIWKLSSKYNIQLQSVYTRPQLQRENDFALMEKLVHSGQFSQAELLKINRLRIYLQVQFLSDITTVQGNFIKEHIYNVNKSNSGAQSKWQWPHQVLNSKIGISLWRRALVNVFAGTGTRRLQQPLLRWLVEPHIITTWLLSPCRQLLYHTFSPTSYIVHHRLHRYTDDLVFTAQSHCTQLPPQCSQVEICRLSHHRIRVSGIIRVVPLPVPILRIQDGQFQTSTPSLHSILRFSTFPDDGRAIAELLQDGTGVAVTDASVFSPTIGAAAWVIQSTTSSTRCEGRVRVPIGSAAMNSYRAEIFGIYTILTSVKYICKLHSVHNGKLTVACDNDDGLLHSLVYERRIPVRFKSFDFLWAIHDILQSLPITIIPEKVEGHTDRLGRSKTLLERLNIEMDTNAKAFCRYIDVSQIPPPILHDNENWSILINSTFITEKIESAVSTHIQTQALFAHLVSKQQITRQGLSLVAWDVLSTVHENLPRSRYIWVVKYASRFLPTANHMHRHGSWDTNLCPLCNNEIETNSHLMKCTCPHAVSERHSRIYDLQQWMMDNKTDPNITQTIIYTLINDSSTKFAAMVPPSASSLVHQAAIAQDTIGWDNFLTGRLASDWIVAQQRYYDTYECGMNDHHGRGWICRLIPRVYDLVHHVWSFRNSVVHEAVEEKLNRRELQKLNEDIDTLYELGADKVRPTHRTMFVEGIDETKRRGVRDKKYWIRTLQASAAFQKHAEENMYVGMRAIMEQWATQPD